MDIKIDKSDIIWSYLGVIVSFTSSVISLPIVIHFLDGDTLGLWYVFSSVGSISIIFDFGFTVTFARNITYCWSGAKKLEKKGTIQGVAKEPDFLMMRDVLFTCKKIYFIISVTCLIVLLTAGTAYIIYISSDISGNTHIVAWIIFSISTFLNLYYNYYDSFLRGIGAVKQANINRVCARMIQLLFMYIFLVLGFGILGLSIAGLLFGIVFRYMGKYNFYKYHQIGHKLKEIKEKVNPIVIRGIFKTVWYNAWRDGIVAISFYLSGHASVILCSLYLSLIETGIYSIGLQIANVVLGFAGTLYTTYQPAIQSNWIKGDIVSVRAIMIRILCTYIISYILGAFLVIVMGLPILRIIKPNVIVSVPVMLGLFVNMFIIGIRDCFTSYFSCTNRLLYVPAFIVTSLASILFSLFLMNFAGFKIWGLIISPIMCQLAFNAWYWSYKACKELGINIKNIF